jgi:hypothetical protein
MKRRASHNFSRHVRFKKTQRESNAQKTVRPISSIEQQQQQQLKSRGGEKLALKNVLLAKPNINKFHVFMS